MQDLNSMAALILKAKYFTHSSFREAQLGSKPSYAWTRELLFEGLLWRVGDGRSIKIWDENWLPTPSTYEIQSIPRGLNENTQ
jgi:hypothetical protein